MLSLPDFTLRTIKIIKKIARLPWMLHCHVLAEFQKAETRWWKIWRGY
jgi:hypothetical protein